MKTGTFFIRISLFLLPFSGHAQAWKWAQSLGAPDFNTSVKNIRPYAGTSLLVCGSFAAPALSLGIQTLGNAGQDDGFVAIADDAGQYAWAAAIGGSGRDFVTDAAAAPNGEFVVAGNFNSISLTVGSFVLPGSGETDAFLLKYHPDKTLAWAFKIGTANIDEVNHVALDDDGNIYVSGQVTDKLSLATLFVFLRKYDPAGLLLWEKTGTMLGTTLEATAMAIDANRNIYLGGSLSGKATFGGISFTSDMDYSAFIVKFNHAGAVIDTAVIHDLRRINGLQAHANHIYACADMMTYRFGWGWPLSDSKIYTLQFDSDLNAVWQKSAGGAKPAFSLDIAQNISVDNLGNAYVTGYFFSDTLQFAGQTLLNLFNVHYYYPQIFVFKYAPSGEEIWGKSFGGIHSDEGTGIHAFGDDQFFLGGNFESDPVKFGNYEIHNTGKLDSMYVHLQPHRFLRKTMGFLTVFDKNVSSTQPEPPLSQVALFPNPASDILTLQLQSPARSPLVLQIIAADGHVLRQSEHDGQVSGIRENLSGLTPGLYFVTLRSDTGLFSGKFVKR